MRGTVKRLVRNRGFGFLLGEDGVERFFHRSSVRPWIEFDNLSEDDQIVFEEDKSPKGPRAKNVDLDNEGHDTATQAVETHRVDKARPVEVAPAPKTKAEVGAQSYRYRPATSVRTR